MRNVLNWTSAIVFGILLIPLIPIIGFVWMVLEAIGPVAKSALKPTPNE